MSGPEAGAYGGPSDDGVGVALWRLSHRMGDAREAHVQGVRDEGVSPVVRVLLARLGAPAGGEVR